MNTHTASSSRQTHLFRCGLYALSMIGLGAVLATSPAQTRAHTPPTHVPVAAANTPGAATAAAAPSNAEAPVAEAEVRRVDLANGRLQLRHGPIPNLDMPPMTMVFRVKSSTLLEGLKEGDQILFSAEKVNGAYVVTRIEKRP